MEIKQNKTKVVKQKGVGIKFQYNDGGRKDAGFKGETGDCVVRAIVIATQLPYRKVYDELNVIGKNERIGKSKRKSNSRTGVKRKTYEKYLKDLGWKWVPQMFIGSGCKTHLIKEELPEGSIIVRVSKHLVAVLDGVIYDIEDCSRGGTRCVYGYFKKEKEVAK